MESAKIDILSEISALSRIIEEQHPELQKYLDENRSTLPQGNMQSSIITEDELINYRDTLKALINNYSK